MLTERCVVEVGSACTGTGTELLGAGGTLVVSAGRREDETIGVLEVGGDGLAEEEWSKVVLVGSANEVELGAMLDEGALVTVLRVDCINDVEATARLDSGGEVAGVFVADGVDEAELIAMLLVFGGVGTVLLVGRITSTSMTAVSLFAAGRNDTEVPTVASRTVGFSTSNSERALAVVT